MAGAGARLNASRRTGASACAGDITSLADLRAALEAVYPQAGGTTRACEAMPAALAPPPTPAGAHADFALKLLHWGRLPPAANALSLATEAKRTASDMVKASSTAPHGRTMAAPGPY